MRFPHYLLALSVLGAAACGPTYVVQGPPPGPAPQRVPEPPRVPPLEVSIVRTEEGRVLLQTSRQAYVAVFEIVPGRGVSLVYPAPMRPRNIQYTGLSWINVYWTMRPDYRYASSETRYIYAVASDTPLRLEDDMYDPRRMERSLGSAYWSSSPNATVRAIAREFVRQQPDEWWGEDMTSMTLTNNRVNIVIRLARVYCPDGNVFEVREDMIDRVWCPARRGGPRVGERPGAALPDSVFNSTGRRVPRRIDPSARTPIFRVPAGTDVGQQQGQPTNQPQNQPRNVPPGYPRTQPQPPQTPAGNNPQTPPQNQPPQTQPPQNQPPQNQPPQTQPPQNQPPVNPPSTPDQNGNDKDHHDNGRRAHGDPQNADPRGNGNGYGNGGRNTPATQPPAPTTPPTMPPAASNPQPQQQGQPQSPSNNGQGQSQSHGNGNGSDNGKANGTQNPANSGSDHGKSPNAAKPDHNDAPKTGVAALIGKRAPQPKQDKKAPEDSTEKKKP